MPKIRMEYCLLPSSHFLYYPNRIEGFRFITVQKFWTEDDYGQPIQRNFLVLEKAAEEEL